MDLLNEHGYSLKEEEYSLTEIVSVMEKYYQGMSVKSICKVFEIDEQIFRMWLKSYSYIAIELIGLKSENDKLRKLLADLMDRRQRIKGGQKCSIIAK